MKKFEKVYKEIISEMYTDNDFENMNKFGLNTTWIKFLQENGFKELADRKFVFQKEKENDNVILEIDLNKDEINFIWWSGKNFYSIKDIDLKSDPAKIINSAIQECSESLFKKAEAVKSLA